MGKKLYADLDRMLKVLYEKDLEDPKTTISSSYAYNYTVQQLADEMKIDFKYAYRLVEILESDRMVGKIEHINKTQPGDYVIQLWKEGVESHLYGQSYVSGFRRQVRENMLEWSKVALIGGNAIAVLALTYFTMTATDNSKFYDVRDEEQSSLIDSLRSIIHDQKVKIDFLTHTASEHSNSFQKTK